MEAFDYNVEINGLNVPLRTTSSGAKSIMKSFHDEPNMDKLLMEAVDKGVPFKNKLLNVSAVAVSAPSKIKESSKKPVKKSATKQIITKKPAKKTVKPVKKKATKKN
jgi:hypothetical protein